VKGLGRVHPRSENTLYYIYHISAQSEFLKIAILKRLEGQ